MLLESANEKMEGGQNYKKKYITIVVISLSNGFILENISHESLCEFKEPISLPGSSTEYGIKP